MTREQLNDVKEFWNSLEPFSEDEFIPDPPKCDEKDYKEFFIPKIIELGGIPKKDLIDGQIYVGKHRNTTIARWNAKTNKFDHMRWKFTWRKDDCNHFEDDDGYALFIPIRLGTQEEWDERLK